MRVPRWILLALVVLAAMLGASPAGAHGEAGRMSVDAVARPGAVEVQVALSFTDDGHPAEDAEVTASAAGPDGTTAGPVTLAHIGLGGYRGELPTSRPGTWTVRVESADPVASAETTVEVAAASAPEPDDGDAPDAADGDGDGDGEPVADAGDSGAADEDDDGGSDAVVWVVVGAVVVVAVVGGAMVLRRRGG